jgi:two-component system sensor histidine kinase YesM
MSRKLIISFVLVVAIPVFVSIFLTIYMRQIVLDNAVEQANHSVSRINTQINEILSSTVLISSQISYDSNLLRTLSADYSSDYGMITALWKDGDLGGYLKVYQNRLDGLNYYVDSKYIFSTGLIKNTPEYIRKTDWYDMAMLGKTKPFWIYVNNDSFQKQNTKSLTLCRPIYFGGNVFGVLVVYVNSDLLNTVANQDNFQTVLCSPQGTVVASNDASILGSDIVSLGLNIGDHGGITKTEYKGKLTNIISQKIRIADTDGEFTIMSLFSIEDILSKTSKTTALANSIVIAGIVLSMFAVMMFSRLLTRRLAKVGRDIHRAASGDFDFIPNEDGNDEIGSLSKDLNHMLINIKALIAEVYEAKIQKQELESRQKDIQLQVLNSQINPHFLFNSLESIRMKAIISGEENIASAVKMLSMMLRKSLYSGNSPIPLTDELDLVRNYLEVQKFRFDERLQYRIDVFTDIKNQTILPFTLQPIVENAVRHGIEETDDPGFSGFVTISVMTEENRLIIRIADNGRGIEPDALAEIRKSLACLESDHAGHIGILNVHQRIKLNYGNEFGLAISSVKGSGTVVTIALPPNG